MTGKIVQGVGPQQTGIIATRVGEGCQVPV